MQAAPFTPLLAVALLACPARAAESTVTNYNFWCSAGSPQATAWYDDKVCLMLEGELPDDRDAARMDTLVQTFNDIYTEFEALTGLEGLPLSSGWNGRVVIQVPLDNCGAGGLANHGSLGMSTGKPFFEQQYTLIEQNKILQVFLYEINRNFWPPAFNQKFDWAMNDEPANWGWWTVGMNNAQAYTMADILGLELEYFGSGAQAWYDGMVANYDNYVGDPQYDFDFGWRQALMPWNPTQSINDLMTGLLLTSYTNWGGRAWLENFYEWIQSPEVPDRTDVFAYQECRDNVYRIWSMSADANLLPFFEDTLRWEISDEAKIWVDARIDGPLQGEPTLLADRFEISASAGGTQNLEIRLDPLLFFKPYLLLGTRSGTGTGLTVDGVHVPIDLDSWTLYSVANANGPVYSLSSAFLIAGAGSPSIVVPPNLPPSAVGIEFHHAALVFDGAGVASEATNALPLLLVP